MKLRVFFEATPGYASLARVKRCGGCGERVVDVARPHEAMLFGSFCFGVGARDGAAARSGVRRDVMWTHWGLNPGPSACRADVIPLHHVPAQHRGECWTRYVVATGRTNVNAGKAVRAKGGMLAQHPASNFGGGLRRPRHERAAATDGGVPPQQLAPQSYCPGRLSEISLLWDSIPRPPAY